MRKAIVLLSGGVDSAVTLYTARKDYECFALSFDYGQKARKEIEFAKKIAGVTNSKSHILKISLPWKGSALLDGAKTIPEGTVSTGGSIPETYVPARNMIFLSFGMSYAEAVDADAVFIGAHQLDYSNYPDCRKEFFVSFQETVRQGTKKGVQGGRIEVITPVIDKTKKDIVEIGARLGVPFEYTWSCYKDGNMPCGVCESCLFRSEAFKKAGITDPFKFK